MKRKCALCGDTCQTNVVFKFRRDRDGMIFHICAKCAEAGKFHADDLHEETTASYTTVDAEAMKKYDNGELLVRSSRRPTMADFYKNKTTFAVAKGRTR